MDGPLDAMELIKGQRNGRAVWRIERPGGVVSTLKTWPLLSKCLLTLPLGIAQPQRQRRGSNRLNRIGVPTPPIIAGPRVAGGLCTLELEWVHGRTALEHCVAADLDSSAMKMLATQLGSHVAMIANAGYVHRDMKLSNIIIESSPEGPKAWIIDTIGIRRCTSKSMAVFRMLERLLTELGPDRTHLEVAWGPLLRAAIRPMSGPIRRAVLERLRSHPWS